MFEEMTQDEAFLQFASATNDQPQKMCRGLKANFVTVPVDRWIPTTRGYHQVGQLEKSMHLTSLFFFLVPGRARQVKARHGAARQQYL